MLSHEFSLVSVFPPYQRGILDCSKDRFSAQDVLSTTSRQRLQGTVVTPALTMSNFPRRSPRFQQQTQHSQPNAGSISSFESSRASSAASTSHPSPTGDITNGNQQYSLSLQSQFLAPPSDFDAPLPSPSTNDIDPFGQTFQFNMNGEAQNQKATSSKQSQTMQQQQHLSYTQPQRPNYPPTSVNGIPPGLPADFLAEAAKRAQMACLMRDLGDVSL